jgi:urocanate hydratase
MGQMTAGSYMYIGPQGMFMEHNYSFNGFRKLKKQQKVAYCHLRTRRNDGAPKVKNSWLHHRLCRVNPK